MIYVTKESEKHKKELTNPESNKVLISKALYDRPWGYTRFDEVRLPP